MSYSEASERVTGLSAGCVVGSATRSPPIQTSLLSLRIALK